MNCNALWDWVFYRFPKVSYSPLHSLANFPTSGLCKESVKYSKGTFPLMRSGSGAVTAGRSGFLGFSVFMLCISTMAVRWRCGGGCPRRIRRMGPEPFFRSTLRSGSGLKTTGIDSLEVSKPLYWYWKYPDRSVIWQENQLLCCCEISERLESFKYQSLGFGISQHVRIRHLNSLFNRVSTGRVPILL